MVRTRFAPSPTGYLHIGGVRTALFNWLFARKHGGQFILRIDDTDEQRNVAAALAPILHGFRWLGLDWDEGPEVGGPHGPYYQSQKQARYQAAVRELVEKGHAYWDYATEDENKAERAAAEAERRSYRYSRRWMARTPAERAAFEAQGRKGVVRLLMPREGVCCFQDHIRGEVEVEWAAEQDSVIQRADGSVLYNLASVVDDFDMGITHVIRAVEHLSNTPRQIFMARGLGYYPLPEYAHLPFVAEPGSQQKLSKRKIDKYLKNPDFKGVYEHGKFIADRLGLTTSAETFNPVIVDFYEQVGYLPDAILNYLVLLGWALDDKTEFFTRREMIEAFTLERVNKSPASFDARKLLAFQEHYMQQVPVPDKATRALPYLCRAGLVADPVPEEVRMTLARVVAEAGPRIVVAGDILCYADFFLPDDRLPYDERAFDKHVRKPPGPDLLRKLRGLVAAAEPFDAATLKQRLGDFAQAEGARPGPVSQTLRVAVTGKDVGFGTYETLEILGRDRCLARIDRALAGVQGAVE
jgi:glutamyl-tRNA synthetase